MDNKKLDALGKVVQRNIQSYKDKSDLNSALSLAESIEQLGEYVDELLDQEEEASKVN